MNMETFAEPYSLIANPYFPKQRKDALTRLREHELDPPLVEMVQHFNKLPYCFSLQCCYGHFMHEAQSDPLNLAALTVSSAITRVEYRIAYFAFCIEKSEAGRVLLHDLRAIREIDPDNIQLCSAQWFWQRQVNSYALQVEPERYKHLDQVILDYEEALIIQKVRDAFFDQMRIVLLDHR